MPPPRRAYVDGPFGQIHYQALGEGPPVLMFHQAPSSSDQFDLVYGPLAARGVHAIGVDMPGFGMSDATPSAPTITDYAQVAPVVLDALGIDRAALLGHHTGAEVATEAALLWPGRTKAVILAGPMTITEAERQDYLSGGHQRELTFKAQPGGEHLVWFYKIRETFAAGTVPPERITDYVVQAMMMRGEYWYGHHAAYQYKHDEAMAKLTTPALILTNTGDVIYDLALRAQALRPDFGFVALEGGGVDITDQQPEAWAEAVAAFVHHHS